MASQTKIETFDINNISGNYDVEAAVVQAEPSNDQERIASAKIVYIVAVSGCGKSFTGDYLETMHGFHHVDGDFPAKNCHIPKHKELTTSVLKCYFSYVNKEEGPEDGPEELWKPYFEEIANQTIDAAKKGSDQHVVLSHATYRQAWREFVVKKLIEGGIKGDNITVLYLTINPDVKLKGLYYRSKTQIENGGMTLGDFMRTQGWEGDGDITLPEYMAFIKETDPKSAGNDTFQEIPDGYGKTVDVSGRDMSHLDGVDDALGLVGKRNDQTLTFEEIRDKVKVVDQKRDEDMAANGGIEIFAYPSIKTKLNQ
ncbi:hypothetical protein FRACYDRAFT_249491 [Fragilariopsis cylindrus CCMP1102]|uniref:Uncharacterized protein n=1 Tax=Fragilariopsis cylindrus CCMP1102 TaxID=635003 RepID=A0A1E7ERX0_9STRA|nr:hypothetical protein FRACYDRAFT_249491 [Fragilariopsis cylindrus CCMP1102]|eukprot:OEU08599.1 hypothetical protein FRACYDRAFT_249491 [Fragilariopsis cylindrus CCMP1102]